jgi:hypothetical protein
MTESDYTYWAQVLQERYGIKQPLQQSSSNKKGNANEAVMDREV